MNNTKFSIRTRLRSFKYAFNGMKILFREEHNARIHFFAICCMIVVAYVLGCSMIEWALLTFAVGFVLVAEAVNSAVERLCDHVCPEHSKMIGAVKDLAAGGVLIAAATALVIALILFVPKIL